MPEIVEQALVLLMIFGVLSLVFDCVDWDLYRP